jgi:LysM repeat protein
MIKYLRMRKIFLIMTSLFLVWLLSAPAFQAKEPAQSGTVTRAELILAMNTLRVSHGLPALIEDPIINAVAQSTAETMAANNLSWHIGDVRGRLAAAGYGGGATVWATENFAVGNRSIDQIMQVWSDPDHMRPAVIPAYCHVGAGVAQAKDGRYYYILQAAYTSTQSCGDYIPVPGGDPGSGENPGLPVSQIIVPVKIATPDDEGRIYHIVQSGQSFWSIAIAYQITINDLEVWNNISRDNGLIVGQKLFIPSSSTEGYATPTPVGMVVLASADAGGKIVHKVQPYQALIMIADAYNVAVDTILALNNLQADWPLQIGQRLVINPGNVTPSPTPRPLTPIEKLTPASDGNYYHVVQSGEYLAGIASLYEVSLAELMAWNGLSPTSIILPEQQLLLRVTPPPTVTAVPTIPVPTSTQPATPISTISTNVLSATPTDIIPAETGNKSWYYGMVLPLLIILIFSGLIFLIWNARWR